MTDGPGAAGHDNAQEPASPPPHSIHLLMVHGVGRHDPLSSLLQVYQSFRSNLRSAEAPLVFEDRIPDWQLEDVEEGAAPPYLKLIPRYPDESFGVEAVYLYEVNYSALAGLVRQNHPLDLTTLFVGLDMAVCASRLKLPAGVTTNLSGGRPSALASCLQRVSGVLTAATVPILGLPSLFFRKYTENIVSAFTRFFEDVATFALDKNGEQLISAHIDRTVENIVKSPHFTRTDAPGELVIAAHSLGSVVAHNFLVRHWASDTPCVPRRLVTFGSPIGFITWLWLFLDFPAFNFSAGGATGQNYFCWSTESNAGKPARPLTWINVVNCLDPIATAFSSQAADLSRPLSEVEASVDGGIVHLFCGPAKILATGRSHTQYVHDRPGFIEILLRTAELRAEKPQDVATATAGAHWASTLTILGRLRVILWWLAVAVASLYCGLIGWYIQDWRPLLAIPLYMFPFLTIGGVAFFQRFFFGGPTKRIPGQRIDQFSWQDATSIPYLVRRTLDRVFGVGDDVDPNVPGRPIRRTLLQAVSFAPTVVAMLVPIILTGWLSQRWRDAWPSASWYFWGLIVFMAYLVLCAGFELVSGWRAILLEIGVGPKPAPPSPAHAPPS